MSLIWQMETKEVCLEGYFHCRCYVEDDKIRQEITKSWCKGGNWLCGVQVRRVHRGRAPDRLGGGEGPKLFCSVSEHHSGNQYQVPYALSTVTEMGKTLPLLSRCLLYFQGRPCQITREFQPRGIRTSGGWYGDCVSTEQGSHPEARGLGSRASLKCSLGLALYMPLWREK